MKTIFIPARAITEVRLPKAMLEKLPKNVGIVAAVQYLGTLPAVKVQLKCAGKNVFVGTGKQDIPGQVLGCDASAATAVKKKVSAILFIGSGEFHPIRIAFETSLPVFMYNPEGHHFKELGADDMARYKKQREGAIAKFCYSDNVGIIVSLKPGQMRCQEALDLKSRIEKKGKNATIFLGDNIDPSELENFNFIESWVNTACPRIEGRLILNYEDLINLGIL